MKLRSYVIYSALVGLVVYAGAEGEAYYRNSLVPAECAVKYKGGPIRGGSNIVLFEDVKDAKSKSDILAGKYGFKIIAVFEHAVTGFSANISADTVRKLLCDPSIKMIEHDGIVSVDV